MTPNCAPNTSTVRILTGLAALTVMNLTGCAGQCPVFCETSSPVMTANISGLARKSQPVMHRPPTEKIQENPHHVSPPPSVLPQETPDDRLLKKGWFGCETPGGCHE